MVKHKKLPWSNTEKENHRKLNFFFNNTFIQQMLSIVWNTFNRPVRLGMFLRQNRAKQLKPMGPKRTISTGNITRLVFCEIVIN